jgi:hypothetical protein
VDVEKTIEFILDQQAKTEATLGALAESHKQTEAQLRQTDLLLKRAIRAAVKQNRAERLRRQQLAQELSDLQRKTEAGHAAFEASLAAFIESMRHGGNGHPKG